MWWGAENYFQNRKTCHLVVYLDDKVLWGYIIIIYTCFSVCGERGISFVCISALEAFLMSCKIPETWKNLFLAGIQTGVIHICEFIGVKNTYMYGLSLLTHSLKTLGDRMRPCFFTVRMNGQGLSSGWQVHVWIYLFDTYVLSPCCIRGTAVRIVESNE